MRKLILLLAVLLLCVPAFAETEPADMELFPFIGNSTREEFRTAVPEEFISAKRFSDGVTTYLGASLGEGITTRHAHEECEENYGWDHETVFYVSISMSGYSLNGIRVGDKAADVDALCLADGWTEMAEAPKNCDAGYEKTVDGVKYTLGYIIEYGEETINLVFVEAENEV